MTTQTPQDAALESMGMGPEDNADEHEENADVADTGDTGDAADIPAGDSDGDADLSADAGDISGDDAAPAEEPDSSGKAETPADSKEQGPTDGLSDAELEKPGRSEKSAERWQKMSDGYRSERETRRTLEAEVGQYKESFKALQDLGFNSAESAQALIEFSQYRAAAMSGDVDSFSEMISRQVQEFEESHGKRPKISAGILDKYPDLQAKVEDLEIDDETASELARGRSIRDRASREETRISEARQTERASQAVLDGVTGEISSMQANWEKTDADYSSVIKVLQPKMAGIVAEFPPDMWARVIAREYRSIRESLVRNATQQREESPLRGNGRAGGTAMVPRNPQEAALAEMGMDYEN